MTLVRQVLAAIVIVLAGCGCVASPDDSTPSSLATSPPSVDPIAMVRFGFADREMEVAIVGPPGILAAWRGATDLELRGVVWDGNADIGLGRLTDRALTLRWIGSICDVEATLIVAPGSLTVSPPARPGCDAMAVERGMVLTFAAPVDPAQVDVRLLDTILLPAPN